MRAKNICVRKAVLGNLDFFNLFIFLNYKYFVCTAARGVVENWHDCIKKILQSIENLSQSDKAKAKIKVKLFKKTVLRNKNLCIELNCESLLYECERTSV